MFQFLNTNFLIFISNTDISTAISIIGNIFSIKFNTYTFLPTYKYFTDFREYLWFYIIRDSFGYFSYCVFCNHLSSNSTIVFYPKIQLSFLMLIKNRDY